MPAVTDVPLEIASLSDVQLFKKLRSHNYNPGPILPSTRSVYERKLWSLQTGRSVMAHSAYPPADDDDQEDGDDESPQPPQPIQQSFFMGRRDERAEEVGTEKLIRKPSPRRPLHPDLGDYYPKYRTPASSSTSKTEAKSPRAPPPAAVGGQSKRPAWVRKLVVIVVVVAFILLILVIKNMESDPVMSLHK